MKIRSTSRKEISTLNSSLKILKETGGREKSGSRSKRGERERGAFFEARVQIVCNPLTKPAFVPKTLIVGQEGANRGQFHALTGQLFARD